MSIREMEPIGYTIDVTGAWREVWDDEEPDHDEVEEENFGESCLTVYERN